MVFPQFREKSVVFEKISLAAYSAEWCRWSTPLCRPPPPLTLSYPVLPRDMPIKKLDNLPHNAGDLLRFLTFLGPYPVAIDSFRAAGESKMMQGLIRENKVPA